MKYLTYYFWSLVVFALVQLLTGCKGTAPIKTVAPGEPAAIQVRPESVMPMYVDDSIYQGLMQPAMVFKFYQEFGNKLVWHKRDVFTRLADTLVSFIANAHYYGLPAGHYHSDELVENDSAFQDISISPRRDALLTDAFITLAHDLRYGQLKTSVYYDDTVYIPLLIEALNQGHLVARLESQEPEFVQYRGLKIALGMLLDSMSSDHQDTLFSSPNIVKSNHSVRLIALNLERWREEKSRFPERYLLVNIPAFSMQIMDSGRVVFESKVIVGKPKRQTPLLSSTIECISIYPYWHVPRKIAVEEYLPILQKDTSFLRRNNFDVLDRQGKVVRADTLRWSRFSKNYFPVSLRQREGEENSLGVVKFIFDNPYAVYLHDTNSKRLFRSEKRAFSHGCVRVENATALSHYLVTGSLGRESKVIAKYLNEKRAHQLNLSHPIPIYIRYFTCDFRTDVLYEYHDVYGMDRALEKLIYANEEKFYPAKIIFGNQ